MHARVEHLLSLRDGEPVDAAVRAHVDGCAQCATALAETATLRARLKALPPVQPAADWTAVRDRLAARELAADRRGRYARLATVASVAVIACALAWRFADAPIEASHDVVAAAAPLTAEQAIAVDRVVQLQSRSAALEDLLVALGERPAVERAGTSLPIGSLEAQVQWIDHQLSVGGEGDVVAAEQLWRDRVEAMDSLVRLRYVEAQSIAM
jgi:hypothetical protein